MHFSNVSSLFSFFLFNQTSFITRYNTSNERSNFVAACQSKHEFVGTRPRFVDMAIQVRSSFGDRPNIYYSVQLPCCHCCRFNSGCHVFRRTANCVLIPSYKSSWRARVRPLASAAEHDAMELTGCLARRLSPTPDSAAGSVRDAVGDETSVAATHMCRNESRIKLTMLPDAINDIRTTWCVQTPPLAPPPPKPTSTHRSTVCFVMTTRAENMKPT